MSRVAQTAEKCTSPTACAPSAGTTEGDPFSQKWKQSKVPTVGIDLLGGDFNDTSHLLATLHALYADGSAPFCLTVFSLPDMAPAIEAFRSGKNIPQNRLQTVLTDEVITMDDAPLRAIRQKKNASMQLGVHLLKEKKIDALISTGNTGALIASAKTLLPTLAGIPRPALLTLLPTQKEPVAVIDVGANVECTPLQLVHFAKMGIAYQKSRGIEKPNIGLLNIGTEETKGRRELRETYQLLQEFNQEDAPFIGNVEGKEVFTGDVHVLVTDGFTGNIFLKTAEGISSFILETMRNNKTLVPFSKPLLQRLEEELYAAESPGALLCGIDGIILKCHGDSNPSALARTFRSACSLINNRFLDKLKAALA